MLDKFHKWLDRLSGETGYKANTLLGQIHSLEKQMRSLSERQLGEGTEELRRRSKRGTTLEELLPQSYALVREAARRSLGISLSDAHLTAAIAMSRGVVAEIIADKERDVVVACPACWHALSGQNIRIVTRSDYRSRHACKCLTPMYRMLGISAGCIQMGMDAPARIAEYLNDITYGAYSEFAFDYLRDNIQMRKLEQCQRGHYCAIVEDADSILLHEARTPFIISGPAATSSGHYYLADKVAQNMEPGRHFIPDRNTVSLTREGWETAKHLWQGESAREGRDARWRAYILQALRAHYCYRKDRDYVLRDKAIVIIDEHTGRLQPGRRWRDGLHQAVEAKESLEISETGEIAAAINVHSYFRLYQKLSGMSESAWMSKAELQESYDLDLFIIPGGCARADYEDVLFGTEEEKLKAVINEIVLFHQTGRPVLVDAVSIPRAEEISRALFDKGIPHELVEVQRAETLAMARAGLLGQITIVTGIVENIPLGFFSEEALLEHWKKYGLAPSDIEARDPEVESKLCCHWGRVFLNEELPADKVRPMLLQFWSQIDMAPLKFCDNVAGLGGIHVIGAERRDSRRMDDHLCRRAGRAGKPGSSRFYLSLEDRLLKKFMPPVMSAWIKKLGIEQGLSHPLLTYSIERSQRRMERANSKFRKKLLKYDKILDGHRTLVYSLRNSALQVHGIKGIVWEMLRNSVKEAVRHFLPDGAGPDIPGITQWAERKFSLKISTEWLTQNRDALEKILLEELLMLYQKREKELGTKTIRELESHLVLNAIDARWKAHLIDMDEVDLSQDFDAYAKKAQRLLTTAMMAIQDEVAEWLFRPEFGKADGPSL